MISIGEWFYTVPNGYVFSNKKMIPLLNPDPNQFKRGTYMFDGKCWHCCRAAGPAPKVRNKWKEVPEYEVPKHLQAYALLLT